MHQVTDSSLFRQTGFINGTWQDANSKATIPVNNPATQEVLGTVPDMDAEETVEAINAASSAFSTWRRVTNAERGRLLEAWYDLIMANLEDLSRLLTLEQGKPLAEARGEIAYGASFVKWFAEEARRINGSTVPSPTTDRRIVVLKEPVGVCAIITPWNFPVAMITRKVAPALAAGCTVVIKPSDLTPYSALALAVLAERAGIPEGVINIITGSPVGIGDEMMRNSLVRKISFTGSTRVGSLLMRGAADNVKRLSLELGGNAPFIVFDDADLDLAIEGVIASKFRNGGQTCVCANRIFVQSKVYDKFASMLVERVNAMKIGSGLDPNVNIGPMINTAAVSRIEAHISDAVAKGAKIASSMQSVRKGSHFAPPVVLKHATTDMLVAREETFGPVAPLFRFETEEEALSLANGTPFGLAAYFFTQDLKRAWRVGEALEAGIVGLNTGAMSTEVAPFGGVKQSGIGREGGEIGIDEFLEVKAFHMGGLS